MEVNRVKSTQWAFRAGNLTQESLHQPSPLTALLCACVTRTLCDQPGRPCLSEERGLAGLLKGMLLGPAALAGR